MKKRVLSLLLAFALCLTLLPTAAFAESGSQDSGTISGGDLTGDGSSTGDGTGGGVYVPPGSTSEGGGGVYEDMRTEIWRDGTKRVQIGRPYDGTTDGSTVLASFPFTDGANEITLIEGTDCTAVKTFDSPDTGDRTVTVSLTLIGDAAARYKLKAGEESFTIDGSINKAWPKLTLKSLQEACTTIDPLLPLLTLNGVEEDAAVTYYYTPYQQSIGSSDLDFLNQEITASTRISEAGTYYLFAKTAATKNYESNLSNTLTLTVTDAPLHSHTACGADACGHLGHAGATFQPWDGTGPLPASEDSSTNYVYLTGNGTADLTLAAGGDAQNLYLCLNGKALSGTITVQEGGWLTLCDCAGGGSISGVTVGSGYLVSFGGKIGTLTLQSVNAQLYGGSFGSIVNRTGNYFDLGILLPDDVAFQGADGAFLSRDTTLSNGKTKENLTVTTCQDGDHNANYIAGGTYLCRYCGKTLAAAVGAGNPHYFTDLQTAFAYALETEAYNPTVSLLCDVAVSQTIVLDSGSQAIFQLELGGHTLSNAPGCTGSILQVTGGRLVLRDYSSNPAKLAADGVDGIVVTGGVLEVTGTLHASGAGCAAVRLQGGVAADFTYGSATAEAGAYAIVAEGGERLEVGSTTSASNAFGPVKIASSYSGKVLLNSGTYDSIEVEGEKFPTVGALLSTYCKFVDPETGDEVDSAVQKVENVQVVHQHVYNENGRCKSNDCPAVAYAKIAGTGDESLDRFYDRFAEALAVAQAFDGCTLTLWRDVDAGSTGLTIDGGSFTLAFGAYARIADTTISEPPYLLRITGGTIRLTGAVYFQASSSETTLLLVDGGDVTICSGNFQHDSDGPLVEYRSGSLTLQGGSYTGVAGAALLTLPEGKTYADLLAPGYFYADADGNAIPASELESKTSFQVTACQTHTWGADYTCTTCGLVCEATVTTGDDTVCYKKLEEALAASKAGDTVTLRADAALEETQNLDKAITLDLGGKTLSCDAGARLMIRAAVTIQDSSANGVGTVTSASRNACLIDTQQGAALTIQGGTFFCDGEALRATCGEVYITGGQFIGELNISGYPRDLAVTLSGGEFRQIFSYNIPFLDLLADGAAFYKDGQLVNLAEVTGPYLDVVEVLAHTHTLKDGVCACGYTCPHTWQNGLCTKCGYTCPHETVTEADGAFTCDLCQATLAASMQAGETLTYYIGLADAMNAANALGSGKYTVTVLRDTGVTGVDAAGNMTDKDVILDKLHSSGSVKLDLNGHTVDGGGTIYAGYQGSEGLLYLTGGGKILHVTIDVMGAIELQGFTGTIEAVRAVNADGVKSDNETSGIIGTLTLGSRPTTYLAGGTIGKVIAEETLTAGQLLLPGYAFQTQDGSPVRYDAKANGLENVTVANCNHAELGEDFAGTNCPYCDAALVALVTKELNVLGKKQTVTIGFADLRGALKLAGGGTVKLLGAIPEAQSAITIDAPLTLDLNGNSLTSVSVQAKATIQDTAETKGTIGKLAISDSASGLTLGDLLEEGDGFRNAGGWVAETSTAAENVRVEQAPIRSLTLRAQGQGADDVATTMVYGATGDVKLVAYCGMNSSSLPASRWTHTADGAEEPLDGVTAMRLPLPADLAAGTHRYRITVTLDGYSKSAEITITVTPVTLTSEMLTIESLTYTGQAQTPTVTVRHGDTVLTDGTDYTLDMAPQTEAGGYTLTVTGQGNYAGAVTADWRIDPVQILGVASVTPLAKTYNGTAAVELGTGAVQFYNDKNETITLPEDAFTITNARLTRLAADGKTYRDAPEAGLGKAISFTVTLQSSNYVLIANKQTCTTLDYNYWTSRTGDFSIEKAPAPITTPGTLTVPNRHMTTYTYDLKPLLPAPPAGQYGQTSYTLQAVNLSKTGYSIYNESACKVEDGVLSLPLSTPNTKETGKVGTVQVTVTTENYEDITLALDLEAVNKTELEAGALTYSPITYGQTLADVTITGEMYAVGAAKTPIPGTFYWEQPEMVPSVGETVYFVFIPEDTLHYESYTGETVLSITPKDISGAQVTLDADQFTYDTSAKTPAVTGVKLGDATLTAGTDYTATTEAQTEAGSYHVTVTGQGNYAGTATADWRIDPKVVDAPAIELGGDFTYTGSEVEPTVTVKDGDVIIPASEYQVIYANNINAGPATVTIKNLDGGNYIVAGHRMFAIVKADAAVLEAPTALTLTYNGQDQTLVTAGKATGGAMQYSAGGTWNSALPIGKRAGRYTVYYQVAGDSNHNDTAMQQLDVTIAPAPVTVTAENKTSRVGQPLQDLTYTCTPALFAGDAFTGALTSAADRSKPGTYAIGQGTLALTDDYALTFVPGTYTVEEKLVQSGFRFAADTKTATYGDAGFSLPATGAAEGSTVTYTSSDETVATVDGAGNVHILKAGETILTATASSTADYLEAAARCTLTVQPKTLRSGDLEKTGGAITKVYDGTRAASGITVAVKPSALVGQDALAITGTAAYNSANVNEATTITFTPDAITQGNYRLASSEVLTIPGASITQATPAYAAPTGLTAIYGQTLAAVRLPSGWRWMDETQPVGDAAAKTFLAQFTPEDTVNYKTVTDIKLPLLVQKASGGSLGEAVLSQKYTNKTPHTYTPDWSKLPDGQTWHYTSASSVSEGSAAQLNKLELDANGTLRYAISDGQAGDTVTLTLTASCQNYEDFTITLRVALTARDDQAALAVTGSGSMVYGQTQTMAITGGSGSGAVTYRVENASGEARIDPDTGVLTPVRVGTVSVIAAKAGDDEFNDAVSAPFVLTITPATPTGAPQYTILTDDGKTLADAALTLAGSTLQPGSGKLEWIDDAGQALPGSTPVAAGQPYTWRFTPDDGNYTALTGQAVLQPNCTIRAAAASGGSISPAGDVIVPAGEDRTFDITPDAGYVILRVLVDGESVSAVDAYTFENVRTGHSIEAVFAKARGGFVDVPAGSYYEDAVTWAAGNGIAAGTDETHFSPDAGCTRAQAVTFLWRAAGRPAAKADTMPFVDVPAGSYYADAILWAVESGIVAGTDATHFSPDASCTRAHAMAFLWRAAGRPAPDAGAMPFADVPAGSYYADAVLWAFQRGIAAGTSAAAFRPDASCTRAQIVTFLWRFQA